MAVYLAGGNSEHTLSFNDREPTMGFSYVVLNFEKGQADTNRS